MGIVMELMAVLGLDSSSFESGLDKASQTASGFGDKLGSGLKAAVGVGAAALTATTGAAVAFGKSAVDAGMEFDSAMSQVAATMGVSTDEITDLRDFAKEMGATTAFSATEAAEALNYMALAGYDSETAMRMLPTVLNLAAAGGMDLATASDMVTDTQSALNLSLEETEAMVDQMAKTSSKTNTSVSQLGDALLTIGATARGVKGGTVELSSVLGVLADNGIKAGEGGTHLRNILLSLQTPTKNGTEALEQLGLSYEDMYDEAGNMRSLPEIFQQLSDAMEGMTQQSKDAIVSGIFNKTDLAAVNALIGTSTERWEELEDEISHASSASAAVIAENLQGAAVEWGKYADEAWMRFGESESLENLGEQIRYNLEEQGLEVAEVAEFIASEYNMSMEDAAKAVDSVKESLESVKGAADDMAKTQLDNLSGDMTLFQSALEGARLEVSDKLTPTLRDFVQLGTSALSEMTLGFQEDGLQGAMGAFGTFLSNGLALIAEKLPEAVSAGAQVIGALVQGIGDNIPLMADSAVQIARSFADMLITNLPPLLSAAAEMIVQLGAGIGDALPDLVPAAVEAVVSFAQSLIDNTDSLIDSALAIITGLAEGIIKSIPILIKAVPQIISSLVKAIVESLPKIGEAGGKLLGGLVADFPKVLPDILKAVGSILESIVEAILGGVVGMTSAGINLIAGLGKGLVDGAVNVINQAKAVASNVLSAIKGFFGIASPSKVMRKEVGQMIGKGLIQGMEDEYSDIRKTIDEMSGIVSPEINIAGNLEFPDADILRGFVDAVDIDEAEAVGRSIPQRIRDGVREGITAIRPVMNELGNALVLDVDALRSMDTASLVESLIPDGRALRGMAEDIGSSIPLGIMDGMEREGQGLQAAVDGMIADMDVSGAIRDILSTVDEPGIAEEAGESVPLSIADGIRARLGMLRGVANEISSALTPDVDIIGSIMDSFDIRGLVSFFREQGKEIPQDIADGMRDGTGDLQSTIEKLTSVKLPEMDISETIDGIKRDVGNLDEVDMASAINLQVSRENVSSSQGTSETRVEAVLMRILDALSKTTITLDGKAMVGYLTPYIDSELGRVYNQRVREAAYV